MSIKPPQKTGNLNDVGHIGGATRTTPKTPTEPVRKPGEVRENLQAQYKQKFGTTADKQHGGYTSTTSVQEPYTNNELRDAVGRVKKGIKPRK